MYLKYFWRISRYFAFFGEFRGISRKYLNFAGPRPREISEALIHVCTFSRVHSSTLLYCEIRIQNSLKCAFLIEQRQLQFMRHFVLPGKKINAVFQAPIENFQIRSKPFVTYSFSCRFSNMAMNNQSTMNPPVPVTILELRV